MKTENLIKSENARRMGLLAKSKLHIYLLVVLDLTILSSCTGTHFVTEYRITTAERSYYCNHPQFVNDTVRGAELKRNGQILRVFEIPYNQVLSVDFNNHKYEWK